MRVSHRSRGPRTDREAQERCVHARPAPSAEPRFSVTVSPLGARGPFSVNSWAASPPGGQVEGREGLGWGGRRLSDSRFPARPAFAQALLTSPRHPAGRKAAVVCAVPSGDRGFASGAQRLAPADTGGVPAARLGLGVL